MGIGQERFVAVSDETCLHCGFCTEYIDCPNSSAGCIGCGTCIKGCPQGARLLRLRTDPETEISCIVDGELRSTVGSLSVQDLLRTLGHDKGGHGVGSDRGSLCGTGGCWSCAVLIDGALARSCVTPLRDGMEIITRGEALRQAEPKRIVTVMRPHPHRHPTLFTHGCNYHCGSCHNWDMTFGTSGPALYPSEAVSLLRLDRSRDYWVGISGGEPTLNRPWLVKTVREIRRAHPDMRIQLDTNASLLTRDYVDELAEAGITDLSPDLKAKSVETFMKLCGITSKKTARQYLDTSWNAVRYLHESYHGRIFMAVSLPYHPRIHSRQELKKAASAICEIDRDMPITLIEYQPAFRMRDWPFVSREDMDEARRTVESSGLHNVIVQGGPELPVAVDPLELALGSEDF